MADQTTNLDLISINQSQKEVTANALFDAASPATIYGRRASTTAGLTFGYYGGRVLLSGGSAAQIANGTVLLTASDTNYIVAKKSDGVVSASTSSANWNDSDYWRLYEVTTGASTMTDYVDHRLIGDMTSSGGGGGGAPSGGLSGQVLVKASDSDGDVKWSMGIGENALSSITSGENNIAFGANALRYNESGSNNIALGNANLSLNKSSHSNIAIGHSNLYLLESGGGDNIALGSSLGDLLSGSHNIGIAYSALDSLETGSQNVAIGENSSDNLETGNSNCSVGERSLLTLTEGHFNTAIGGLSLGGLLKGSGNIGIGGITSSGTPSPVFDFSSVSGIADDRIVMGSTAVTNAYIKVAWTVTSDARDKTEIQPIQHGLDFVNQLNPVSYKFRVSREDETPSGNKRYGFLAQEVLALEGEDNVIVDNETPDHLRYNGESLVPVLVKAIQQQSYIIKELKQRIESLENANK